MKTVFGLQITSRDDKELQLTADALKAVGLPFINFGVIPFTDEITNLEGFKGVDKVLPLCGTRIIDMYLRRVTPPEWELYYSHDLFDQRFYSDALKKRMVNGEGVVFYRFRNIKHRIYKYPVFVKPCDDLKMFTGFVLEPDTSLLQALEKTTHQPFDDNQIVMICDPKSVTNEYRLFVVDNLTVGISQYRNAKGLHKEKVTGDLYNHLFDYHTSLGLEVPHPYVIDLAQIEDQPGFSIMEFNCFNCCGMYDADREAVFRAIANYEGM